MLILMLTPITRRFAILFLVAGVLHLTMAVQSSSQVLVLLRDTTVQRGSLARVDVRVSSLAGLPRSLDSVRLVVRYSPSVLVVESIRGGLPTTLFNCPAPQTDSLFENLNLGFFRILCTSLKPPPANPSDTATLVSLTFLTLAARDSVALVSVDSLIVNGSSLPIMVRPARITVIGGPIVFGQFRDALGQNYPNPAGFTSTAFPYTIAETSDVRFAVFSAIGQMVYEFPIVRRQQGRFILQFLPPPSLSNGLYSLRMTTAKGAYTVSFQIVR
jgi:hypothetical protein